MFPHCPAWPPNSGPPCTRTASLSPVDVPNTLGRPSAFQPARSAGRRPASSPVRSDRAIPAARQLAGRNATPCRPMPQSTRGVGRRGRFVPAHRELPSAGPSTPPGPVLPAPIIRSVSRCPQLTADRRDTASGGGPAPAKQPKARFGPGISSPCTSTSRIPAGSGADGARSRWLTGPSFACSVRSATW